jgi:glutamate/tyrosine decarboxylase-like PLP-dependent enzyme
MSTSPLSGPSRARAPDAPNSTPDLADSELLARASELASAYLAGLRERAVGVPIAPEVLRAVLGGHLPEHACDPREVLEHLATNVEAGLVASSGPRYFGFVMGGSLPITVASGILTSAWDQNAGNYVASPAMSVAEEVAGGWLKELFGLPAHASFGFVTGGTMANFTCLAAARHAVLRDAGWDVEAQGLLGSPPIQVVVGEEAHTTIFVALRMLGLGAARALRVPVDGQGRMRADALRTTLGSLRGPTIVCAQAGNVNSGAFDPLRPIAESVAETGGWLHVDGAFGLWAAASDELRALVDGVELAKSWAIDAHKWLNVPYDCGIALTADPEAHRSAMNVTAAYLVRGANDGYNEYDWVPESSRRARGFGVYAALRTLGRSGAREIVERCCRLARQMAERLSETRGVEILNEVVLNQVLARFSAPNDDAAAADQRTRDVATRVQQDGTCWLGTTTWHGVAAIRISVSNWSTTEEDIDRSAAAILRIARELGVG